LAINEYIYFIRGAGGFGGDRGPSAEVNEPPARKPDAVVEEKIAAGQALLYRLSGDINPLHVDPGFAKAFGFERPILHGLCTYGFAARHVVGAFAKQGDPRYFKSIKVRFAKSVFPGDTLVTEMWKESDTRILFRTSVKERSEVVLTAAAVELYTEIPKPKPKAKPAEKAPAASAAPISADIFTAIGSYLGKNAETLAKVGKVFQFKLSGPDSVWTVDVKGSNGVSQGETAKPDCTLELSDGDFMDMCTGKADAQKLYFGGQLKISGDVMASQKLSFLKKLDPQMVIDAMSARGGAGGAGAAPSAPATAASGPQSSDVFLGIKAYVGEHAELTDKIQKVFQFKLENPVSVWTLDLKNGKGAVAAGETAKPDCTLTIDEADFMDMTSGKADAQKLYFGGKLKISGDVMASQKLSFLSKIDPAWAKEQVEKLKAAGVDLGSASAAAPAKQAQAPKIVAALKKRIADKPKLVDEIQAVVVLKINEPDGAWTVDLKSGKGAVRDGAEAAADSALVLSDEGLASLARGEGDARDMFMRGTLRIDGDMAVAHKLGFLSGLL
jgi:3-hydroxyacyl-CoA dehydrogenase/3a,7a,12a-trihydroxy-5b-cholest-24-enoyl-CoA hydratase